MGALGPAEPALFTTVWGLLAPVWRIFLLIAPSVLGVAPPAMSFIRLFLLAGLLLKRFLRGVWGDDILIVCK